MKKFIEILEENGICVPEKKAWMPEWLYKKIKKAFYIKWDEAHRCYNSLIREVKKKNKEYTMYNNDLLEYGFEIQMPALPSIEPKPFKTPKKAVEEILSVIEALGKYNSKEVFRTTEEEGRKLWAQKILQNKPSNCKKIVVKNSAYVPAKELVEKFEANIETQEVSCIHGMFGLPQWMAVYVEYPKLQEALAMIPAFPKDIVVEYI